MFVLFDDCFSERDGFLHGHESVFDAAAGALLLQFVEGLCVGDEEGQVELVLLGGFGDELEREGGFAFGVDPQAGHAVEF